MDAIEFGGLVDRWSADVKEMALVLFRAGVPAEKVMTLAIQCNDARTIANMARDRSTAPRLYAPRPS